MGTIVDMDKPTISILCPTRGRPGNIKRLIDSATETASRPRELEFVFYFDNDDNSFHEVLWGGQLEPVEWEVPAAPFIPAEPPTAFTRWSYQGVTIKILQGPRIVLSQCWNRCYGVAGADILMQCGDDIAFRTDAWDLAVIGAFALVPDRIALVYGDDGIQHQRVATHGFLHRRWVQVVGYFVPPHFASDWNDMWLTEVAKGLDRLVYLSKVYTEHMHPVANKGPMDKTHLERLHRHNVEDCDGIYARTAGERRRDIARLQAYVDGFAARRAALASETVSA